MSTKSVILSPGEVRAFAHELRELTGQLAQRTKAIDDQTGRLRHIWDDRGFHQFHRRYTESMSMLNPFFKQAQAYAEYLDTIAARGKRVADHGF
jgi:uncharacterized protein YukE